VIATPARVFDDELEKLDENKVDIGLPGGFVVSFDIGASVDEPVALGATCEVGVAVTEVDERPSPAKVMARK
jgi:hypothetical protein